MNTEMIEKIANEYNENNLWYFAEVGKPEEHDIPNYPLSTTELLEKYNPTFEECERIDSKIDYWDNEDISMTSAYIYSKAKDLDDKFLKEHADDIESAIWQWLSLDDGCGQLDNALWIFSNCGKYIDVENMIESFESEGIDMDGYYGEAFRNAVDE